jgi:hypothetical protein
MKTLYPSSPPVANISVPCSVCGKNPKMSITTKMPVVAEAGPVISRYRVFISNMLDWETELRMTVKVEEMEMEDKREEEKRESGTYMSSPHQ